MAASIMKALRSGQRVLGALEQAPKALAASQQQSFHKSGPVQGTLTIPERLEHVPDAEVTKALVSLLTKLLS